MGPDRYSRVVSTLALFVALGGTAMATTSLIDGHSLKKGSVPGNRLKSNTLTGRQIKESTLGRVPKATLATSATSATSAAHAATADSATSATTASTAGSAASAEEATHAAAADTLSGGYAPSSFVSSTRHFIGIADPEAVPKQTLFTIPSLGLALETDGDAGFESSVRLRNVGTATLGRSTAGGVTSISAGGLYVLDSAGDGWNSPTGTAVAFVNLLGGPYAVIRCMFPTGGFNTIETVCQADVTG